MHAHLIRRTLPNTTISGATKDIHYKMSLEPQGPSELHVIYWSKVLENNLETQAGMLGSQGSGLIYLCNSYL